MKALIRGKGETVVEDISITYIDWNTGAPLTNPYWAGGPYTLVENYIPPAEDEETVVSDHDAERIAELKKLLAELEK